MIGQQQPDRSELQMLYQVTVSDLAYFKTQQWAVTYYSLLVDAALVGVAQLLRPELGSIERLVLSGLALFAALAAVIVLSRLEKSISVRRSRLDAVRSELGNVFQRAWAAEHKGEEYIHAIYILYGGVVITGLLTMWLIVCRM